MQDAIEKSILLSAAPDRVWRALSDAAEFGRWFRAEVTGEMREGIAEETSGTDILFVESIELLPEYRGRALGLAALRRTLEFLGGGCAVAVVWAYPNRYDEVQDRDRQQADDDRGQRCHHHHDEQRSELVNHVESLPRR